MGWKNDFSKFVDDFLKEQVDPQVVERGGLKWQQFFCNDDVGNGLLLESAGRRSNADTASFPVEVLSRAALLLRIATGSCGLHLKESGNGWNTFEFWLNDIGVRRGFWERGGYPEHPDELWADIFEALETLDDARQNSESRGESPHGANSRLPASSLMRLEECERIGLWGFGI